MATKTINTILNLRDKFSNKMQKAANETKGNSKQMKLLNNQVSAFKRNAVSSFGSVVKSIGGLTAAYLSLSYINNFKNESVELAKAQIEAETKLGAVLQNVQSIQAKGPEAYKDAQKRLMGVASELQSVGVIGDEVTLAGMQQLATFQMSEEAIANLSGGMLDLLAQQKGLNATQQDAVGIGNMIGKVMNGQVSALSRVGISFTKSQEEALKTGDELQRAAVLAEVLQQNVGGVNKALAGTDQGKIQQANNAWGDMQEEIGKKILPLQAKFAKLKMKVIPYIQNIGEALGDKIGVGIDYVLQNTDRMVAFFKSNIPKVKKLVTKSWDVVKKAFDLLGSSIAFVRDNAAWTIPVIAGLASAIAAQKVIGTISKLYKSWHTITKGMSLAQAALNIVMSANPFGLVALAIGAVIGVGVYLWKNWDTVKEKAQQLWTGLQSVWGSIQTYITDKVSSIAEWLNSFPIGQGFLETITGVVDSTKEIFGGITQFLTSVFKGDWEGAWDGIVQSFNGTFSMISTFAKAPINAVIDMINGLIDKVNSISITLPDFMGGETFGVNIPKIPRFALGTGYFRGGLAEINERGGEIVNLPNGSQVIPAARSERMMQGMGGGVTVQIIVQGDLIGEEEHVNRLMNKAVPKLIAALGNV